MEKIKVTLKEIELMKKRALHRYSCGPECDMWFEGCCGGEEPGCDRYQAFIKVEEECKPYEEHLREIEGDSHILTLIHGLNDIDSNNKTIAILERCNLKRQSIVDSVLDKYVEIDDGSFDILDGTKEEKI